MNKILVMILALLLTACASHKEYTPSTVSSSSDTLRIYDSKGNFAGHINERSKRIYDRDGNFVGMIK